MPRGPLMRVNQNDGSNIFTARQVIVIDMAAAGGRAQAHQVLGAASKTVI